MKAKRKNKKIIKEYKNLNRSITKQIKIICSKCYREYIHNTTSIEIYTPEIRKNWICLYCKEKLSKAPRIGIGGYRDKDNRQVGE